MKIFITGIAGFLGSHLAEKFLADGHQVVGCDNLVGGYEDNVPDGADLYPIDCTDFEGMVAGLKGCDVCYHCAATAYEGLSVFSPSFVSNNIYQATATVASACVKTGVKKIVFTSSMARYGSQETPFTEDMTPKPQDPYGIAKYASELLLRNICDTHGLKLVIAVPHNIYGPKQKYNDPFRNVASIMINRMLQGKQPIIYGDGTQVRCFSYIDDCIFCLAELIEDRFEQGEIINIGPDEEFVTINELAVEIADILNFDLTGEFYPDRPQEVKYAVCSSDKARKLLGYKTTVTLRKGLEGLVLWIKKRGVRSFDYHINLEIEEGAPETWKRRLF